MEGDDSPGTAAACPGPVTRRMRERGNKIGTATPVRKQCREKLLRVRPRRPRHRLRVGIFITTTLEIARGQPQILPQAQLAHFTTTSLHYYFYFRKNWRLYDTG
jgi:hypothetical protein